MRGDFTGLCYYTNASCDSKQSSYQKLSKILRNEENKRRVQRDPNQLPSIPYTIADPNHSAAAVVSAGSHYLIFVYFIVNNTTPPNPVNHINPAPGH
jgi:hypothetical protein